MKNATHAPKHPTPHRAPERTPEPTKKDKEIAEKEVAAAEKERVAASRDATPPAPRADGIRIPDEEMQFPARTTPPAKLEPMPSIFINGTTFSTKDGIKADMSAGELAKYADVPLDRFLRLEYHTRGGGNRGTLDRSDQSLHIVDGLDITVIGR